MTDQVHDRESAPGEAAPDEGTAGPKRKFKFPTAFTVLFFVLVLVWILTFIIPPGAYSYVSCDGGTPKPIPGTFGAVKVDLSFQERCMTCGCRRSTACTGYGRRRRWSRTPAPTC